jgi:DNA-binding Xre family transcriptional regulator
MASAHKDVRMTEELTLSAKVAIEIRAALGRRDMSRSELSRRLGVSAMWVSDRLRGKTPIGLDDLERIANVLELEPVDLLPTAAVPSVGSKPPYVPGSVRPPEHRSKGRPDGRNSDRPKGRSESRISDRRSRQKRALTPEELSLLSA